MENHYDVIVIGAGVGGLSAAGLLAKAGQRVLVLERHSVVGGYCSTFRRAHFIFDVGVHIIGGGAADDIIGRWCSDLGVTAEELQFIKLNPFYNIDIAGEQIPLPADLDELAETLGERYPSERDALQHLAQEIKSEGAAILQTNFQGESGSSMGALGRTSWYDFLSQRLKTPELITLLCGICLYSGVEPQQASALFMVSMFYSYHSGAYYPRGSSQRLANTLASAIRRHGGEIRCRTRVEQILLDKRASVQGVRLASGEEFTATTIISTADATTTLSKMMDPNQTPNSLRRRLRNAEYAPSATMLYLALKDGPWREHVSAHETFFLPSWQVFDADTFYYRPGQPERRFAFSLSVPSLSDPSLAPANHHVLALTALAHHDDIERVREQQGKSVIEEDICAHAEQLLPGVNDCIIYREVATPRTFEHYTGNGNGAIYGWAKNTQHITSALRLQTPIKGLYLAGQWTQGTHGVYGSFLSGVAVAQKIQQATHSKKAVAVD